MNDWPDQKIQNVALWYIRKHSMDLDEWSYTKLGELHSEVSATVHLEKGELPIVSSFISDSSWYAFTTRRVLGTYDGRKTDELAVKVRSTKFGFFKRIGDRETEVMTLEFDDGSKARLEFETGKASMAPIYAERFWWVKYPALDAFKYDPAAEAP